MVLIYANDAPNAQEMASRGLAAVYDLADEATRKALLDGLIATLSGGLVCRKNRVGWQQQQRRQAECVSSAVAAACHLARFHTSILPLPRVSTLPNCHPCSLPYFHSSTPPPFHPPTLPPLLAAILPLFHSPTLPPSHTATPPPFHASSLPLPHRSDDARIHASTLPHRHPCSLPCFASSVSPHVRPCPAPPAGAPQKRRAIKLSGESQLFEKGQLGATPGGGSLTTYKELCSLATDLGQPDLGGCGRPQGGVGWGPRGHKRGGGARRRESGMSDGSPGPLPPHCPCRPASPPLQSIDSWNWPTTRPPSTAAAARHSGAATVGPRLPCSVRPQGEPPLATPCCLLHSRYCLPSAPTVAARASHLSYAPRQSLCDPTRVSTQLCVHCQAGGRAAGAAHCAHPAPPVPLPVRSKWQGVQAGHNNMHSSYMLFVLHSSLLSSV